jgi:NAD(P)-dependent dehydrogenase (short-subunit alcohol dehydrogenase family)
LDLGLTSKVAIVGGASHGIGRATAEVLAEEGCRLAICARRPGPLEEVRAGLAANGAEVYAATCDLASAEDIQRFVAGAIEKFGTVHVLVNNGPNPPWGPRFDEASDESLLESWEAKFLGYVRMSKAVLPAMRSQRWGRIIHVGGMAGQQPGNRYVSGSAIHAALPNLAKVMSDTYGRENVLVNCISPGPIATQDENKTLAVRARDAGVDATGAESHFLSDVALGRFGSSREVADVIAFLCSEQASFITGTDILVDGGRSRGI